MARRYNRELAALAQVYADAAAVDVSQLVALVRSFMGHPLSVIGSGGSFSSATFAAMMHEYSTGDMARAITPLEYLSGGVSRGDILCLSASGRNRDIGMAFRTACQNEAGVVGALVMSEESPLHALQRRFQFARVVSVAADSFKDGFLAVATLIATCVALIRAYNEVSGEVIELPDSIDALAERCLVGSSFANLKEKAVRVTAQETTCLLYAPVAKAAAVDLESRFVEAALGNLHASDLRNFGHGRHNWLAKRGERTGIISFVSADLAELSERTHDILPKDIARLEINLQGPYPLQAVTAVIAGLFVSEAAGENAGIDPGRPGVPQFGRRLYRLGPGNARTSQVELNKKSAIRRKAPRDDLAIPKRRDEWEKAYKTTLKSYEHRRFGAVVLDYDGTLCDVEERFKPLRQDVGAALERLLNLGCDLGIATGRGPSAGKELRKVISPRHWGGFKLGYYNGAVLTNLEDDRDPIVGCSEDNPLYHAIKDAELFADCDVRFNDVQVSLRLDGRVEVDAAAAIIREISDRLGRRTKVITSGHSIDIVDPGTSKNAVVVAFEEATKIPGQQVLRIGDQGAWPGNDASFLDSPNGLTVDRASSHRTNCWNLAPAGVKSVQATLYYLNAITSAPDGFRLNIRAGDRGATNAA